MSQPPGSPPPPPGGYPPQPPQQPYTMPPATEDPGKTLGIIGLILSFFTALIGMIVSIIAFRMSKKAGFKNTPALIGIIIGAIGTLIGVIIAIAVLVGLSQLNAQCQQLGSGQHEVNGVTVTCP